MKEVAGRIISGPGAPSVHSEVFDKPGISVNLVGSYREDVGSDDFKPLKNFVFRGWGRPVTRLCKNVILNVADRTKFPNFRIRDGKVECFLEGEDKLYSVKTHGCFMDVLRQ